MVTFSAQAVARRLLVGRRTQDVAIENAFAGLRTNKVSMSSRVNLRFRNAGMNAVNNVSKGRNLPPLGSPTEYHPASCDTNT